MAVKKFSIIIGAVLFGTLPLFVRNMALDPLHILFFRVLFGGIFLFVLMLLLRERLYPKNFKLLLLLTLSNTMNMFFYMSAIKHVNIAVATLLDYTGPIFVVPLSYFILHEKITKKVVIALPVALFGLVFLLSTYGIILNVGILFGLLAGISLAFTFILLKMLRIKESTLHIIFYQLILASLILSPLALSINFSAINWYMVIGLGLVPTALAYIFLIYGMRYCTAQEGSILALFEPVSATVFAFIILKESLTMVQIFGALLILLSVFVIEKKE